MTIVRAQGKRVKAIIFAIYTTTDNQELNIHQRPWYMFWFMGQIYRQVSLVLSPVKRVLITAIFILT